MVNGKSKGSEFERVISKKLSLWWTDNERSDVFWRTSNSGGRHTIRKRKGEETYNQSGDICSIDPIGQPFSDKIYLECKSYKSINIWSLFTGKGLLVDWWNRANEIAKEEGKKVFLITKENSRPVLLFTNIGYFYCQNLCEVYIKRESIQVYNFDTFLKCPSTDFKECILGWSVTI